MILFVLAQVFTVLASSLETCRLCSLQQSFHNTRAGNYNPYCLQNRFHSTRINKNFPNSVSGVAQYDPFDEYLPQNKGVYRILNRNGVVKYIGSSNNIHKRMISHRQSGVLLKGDRVTAIIFHQNTKQKTILNYERKEIKKFNPIKNISSGAHGRGWDSERAFKLQHFYLFSSNKILVEYRRVLKKFLCGKEIPSADRKVVQVFLKTMKYFK